MRDRRRMQTAARVASLAIVVCWLFSERLRAWMPFWLPLAILAAAEIEFLVRGWRERRADPAPRDRRPPGPEDADLGWGELVEDDDEVRYVPPPVRAPRGRRRPLVLGIAALAAAVVVVLAARADRDEAWASLDAAARSTFEGRLASEASRIAGRPVLLRCDEGYAFTGAGSDTLGVAFPTRGLAYLDPAVCRDLYDLSNGSGGSAAREALVVLAHEAVHLRGERREGVTECLALQEAVPLARRFGLDESEAHRAMRAEYERRLAERSAIRAAYALPATCTDGGRLDLRPADARFP